MATAEEEEEVPPTCSACEVKGDESRLRREPGWLICDACDTKVPVAHDDAVEALLYETEQKLRSRHPALFDPGMPGLPRRLRRLDRDAWWMIATERYNSGIVLLGTLVEATLQEVLYVHRYEFFRGTLGRLIGYLRSEEVLDPALLDYADRFRATIRNKWQHQKVHEITGGASIPAVKFSLDEEDGLEQLVEQAEAVKSGELKLEPITPEEEPAIRVGIKDAIDQSIAVPLYNRTWMWLLYIYSRYLRNVHYAELHERYDGGPARTVRWRNGSREEIETPQDPGAHRRALAKPIYDSLSGRA